MGKIKKAFTLAEVMIVLTVIGILTAILLPAAFRSTPDENIMKFKKANETLSEVINELVTSDKYYTPGDLGKRANGADIYGGWQYTGQTTCIGTQEDIKYFCNTFADLISTKSVNCSTAKTAGNDDITYVAITDHPVEDWEKTTAQGKSQFDTNCSSTAATVGAEIVDTNGVVYYQANPQATFGIIWGNNSSNCAQIPRLYDILSSDYYRLNYKTFCIDVDGIGVGEAPFGYGIGIDGKIIPGARADEWLTKSVK